MRSRRFVINRSCLAIAAGTISALAGIASAQPVTFTQWTFNNLGSGQFNNSPAPSSGRGLAVPLGMTNSYTFTLPGNPPTLVRQGSITACDIASTAGSSDSGNTNYWRVRGGFLTGSTTTAGIGWALQAPQFTQGVEFDVSTLNFSDVVFSFDWFTTNQGVRHMQVQYSNNGGTNWISIGPVKAAVTNGWSNGQTYDFTNVAGVNDNPNFRVRMVSVYDQTLTPPAYASASGGQYNNNSGNWRFDMVTFRGNALRSVGPAATGVVSPPAVCSTGGPLTFTVAAQGGAGPLSTGLAVTADLSPLGLSAIQALRDDGASGDVTPGDGIFTYVATIPGGLSIRALSISATITDAQSRSGGTSIPVIVGDCSSNAASRVVISQVFTSGGNLDTITGQLAPADADYVELFNRSASAVSLAGWSVQYASQGSLTGFDSTGDQVLLSGSIQPGQHILVRMSDPVNGFAPLPTPDFAQLPGFGGMGNTGGRVALVRASTLLGTNYNDARIEDFLGYGNSAISFEGNGPSGGANPVLTAALVRKQSGAQDTNQNFNDFSSGPVSPRNRADGGFLAGFPATSLSAACAGSGVTFSVTVVPGSSSTNIAVNADVSSIVGSPATVVLLDNGVNGDAQAGDGIYAATYAIPSIAAQGNRTIGFIVSDAQGRTDTSSVLLDVGNCGNSNAPVVISKVYGGGGNGASGFNSDFAEIFNRSDAPVNLNGWSFQSARITDVPGFVSRICLLSGVINPGEYRLIRTNQSSAVGAAIPLADFIAEPLFGMESSFGRVVLVSTTNLVGTNYTRGDVVDLVGYGTGVGSFEGVAPVGTLSDILYAQRKSGGCQDSNQNAIDFEVQLALGLPNNAATPASVCASIVPPCLADIAGGASGPDGIVDGNDFIAFINAFGAGDVQADVAGGASGGPDGIVDGSDFIAFINAFGAGC